VLDLRGSEQPSNLVLDGHNSDIAAIRPLVLIS
jgi:hypothetical protein